MKIHKELEKEVLRNPKDFPLWKKWIENIWESNKEAAEEKIEKRLLKGSSGLEMEQEALWLFYMKLLLRGDALDEFEVVKERAFRFSFPERIRLKTAALVLRAGRKDLAEEIYEELKKKCKRSLEVWKNIIQFYSHQKKDIEELRELGRIGLSLLEKNQEKERLQILLCECEYRNGTFEFGRTLFENLLVTAREQFCVWQAYLGCERKVGDVNMQRRLYERVLAMRMSSKKTKSVLKQYLKFEEEHGTSKGVEHVISLVEQLASQF